MHLHIDIFNVALFYFHLNLLKQLFPFKANFIFLETVKHFMQLFISSHDIHFKCIFPEKS